MTHNQATFIVVSTDGDTALFGLSENGEHAVGNYDTRLDAIANMVSYEARFSMDRPLIVVVGKNKPRATAGEVFLEGFLRDVSREAIAKLPETAPVFVAGLRRKYATRYYSPRVVSLPLPWATKSTPRSARVRSLLDELAFGDEGLALVPKGLTHVAG